MKKLILIFLFIVSNKLLFSQPGWNWPDNKSLAEEKMFFILTILSKEIVYLP